MPKTPRKKIAVPVTSEKKPPAEPGIVAWLSVLGAEHNNLKNVDVHFPLRRFIAVTGVSGSGKSSLVNDVLREALERDLNGAVRTPGKHDKIVGKEHLDKIIDIDQSAIGRTPRSNPATYIKLFDQIRDLYTKLPEAKARGYQAGRFSFNVGGGRCEQCEGNGSTKLEMDFLADVWVTCPVCQGRRFNRETLQVRYREKNIYDVLEMDVQEAVAHFENIPRIHAMLQTLHDVGLDYVKLGQPSPTLSGGEAQRIKLARELCKRSTGRTLYVLDEPTTGLHFEDIRKLLAVLHGFVNAGNTVVVIEHNLDVVKTADWVIDLGPEGGGAGGRVVAIGTPEEVAEVDGSHTGKALRPVLHPRGTSAAAPATVKPVAAARRFTHIDVEGANEHNLKDVSTRLPLHQMTVFCGPSGSGKSSLAIDTLYAEGQRRFVESLSSYARQFLGQMQKPRVERVTGLAPAICIEQKTTGKSPRSTVGTVTEIYDYFRILFARLGQPYCPDCKIPIGTQSSEEIIDKLLLLPDGARVFLTAPIPREGFEDYEALFADLQQRGFVRMRIDGQIHELASSPKLERKRKHQIEVVVDRATIRANQRSRIAESVETALDLGRGVMNVLHVQDGVDEKKWRVERYSQHFACDRCGRSFEELSPNNFSFNSAFGWCPSCQGLGVQAGSTSSEVFTVAQLSIRHGAVSVWPSLGDPKSPFTKMAEALAEHVGFSLDVKFVGLRPEAKRAILYGLGDEWIPLGDDAGTRFQYKGIFPALTEASRVSWVYRQKLSGLIGEQACPTCQGSRLRDDAAAVQFADKTLGEWTALPLNECFVEIDRLEITHDQRRIAGELLREIGRRLEFLIDVGLHYLTLGRPTPTLSGGEAQRIRLASQLGSGLTGVLYLLDEPTIGLHPRDNGRLLGALQKLRDLGNTLILVEHDREVIDAADHLVDFGPGAGRNGGSIVAAGSPAEIKREAASLTGKYLAGVEAIPVPSNRRSPTRGKLTIVGASQNNLQHLNVEIPLGCMTVVTGVSGSGKSSLINDVLWASLAKRFHRAEVTPGLHESIEGVSRIDKVIRVDQQPLGNTPASNPATYTGVFELFRQLYAELPAAKLRGFTQGRFSFNRPGGRCEVCEGVGRKKIEMHFLPDVWVECDVCKGKRFTPETLAVQYRGKSISDVLDMTVADALTVFGAFSKIRKLLQTLADVGLEYMPLGQSAPTLSGGEAQRVKLAAELARPNTGKTLYILDEPTTGLHFDDLRKLLLVLYRLVDLGNSVVVIEHNLDVIKTADWVLDIGPEGGEGGGRLVFAGAPEDLVAYGQRLKDGDPISHTALALAPVLRLGPYLPRESLPVEDASKPPGGDLEIADLAKIERPPWELDGRTWHTSTRVSLQGRECRWEGQALEWIVDELDRSGSFAPADWSKRTTVYVSSSTNRAAWFLEATTSGEWLLRLKFHVARGTFKAELLERQLKLPRLEDATGMEVFTGDPRVVVGRRHDWTQEIEIQVYRATEIQTDEFRQFLAKAKASFLAMTEGKILQSASLPPPTPVTAQKVTPVAAAETKKADDEADRAWHLFPEGFPPGKPRLWKHNLLQRVFQCIEEASPGGEWDWKDRKTAKRLASGVSLPWAWISTKLPRTIETTIVTLKGKVADSVLSGFGPGRAARSSNAVWDFLNFSFATADDFSAPIWTDFLAQQAAVFQIDFADPTLAGAPLPDVKTVSPRLDEESKERKRPRSRRRGRGG